MLHDPALTLLADSKEVADLIRRADYHHTDRSDLALAAAALVELGVRSVGREDYDPVFRCTVARPGRLHYLYWIGSEEEVHARVAAAPAGV